MSVEMMLSDDTAKADETTLSDDTVTTDETTLSDDTTPGSETTLNDDTTPGSGTTHARYTTTVSRWLSPKEQRPSSKMGVTQRSASFTNTQKGEY